ncbi:hypothetical protein F4779DRAFT_188773 [Xylariaceae sp. FL0662B]|nr:hypothetical protein F4779DRAFT_188773 [Xylariaceae sp. FL0662B]
METFRRAMERQQRAVKPDIPLPSFEFSTTGDRCDSSEISPTSDMKPTSDYSTPRQSVVNADGFNSQILQERLSMESSLDLPSPARTRSLSCGVSSSEDTEFAYAWLSPYSEDVPDIEEDHPLFHLRSPFLETAMAAFERGNSQPMDQGNQRNSGETPGRGQEEMSNPTGSRKRSRYSDHPANEDCDRLSTGYHGPRRTRDRRLCLACPFSKKDPVRYRDCYRYMLSRVRDVKQHLARCHRMPLYCPRCMEIFDDEVVRDSHIRSLSCPENPLVGIEGVSEGQKAMLSRRVSSKMTEEQQWYTVFDILFPGHPRPRSPYVDRELSEEMYVFRDFLTSQGPLLLSAFLESRQIVTWNLPQEERDLATFQETILADGLQLIFERWASVNTGARSSSNAPSTSAASQARDSAIAMQDVSTPAPGLDSSQMSSQTNASNDRHSPGPGADTSLTALSRLTGSDIFSSSEISGQELGGDGYMQLPQSEYFDFTSEWSC